MDGGDCGFDGDGGYDGLDAGLGHADAAGLDLSSGDYGDLGDLGLCSLMSGFDGLGYSHGDGHGIDMLGNATVHPDRLQDTSGQDDQRLFAAHVGSHGSVDARAIFAQVAGSLGMCKVPPQRVSGKMLDQFEPTLLPLTAWNKNAKPGAMPSGYVRGATGTTVLWREYWQVGTKKWPWSAPTYDKNVMAHCEVVAISWFFRNIGDCQTILLVRVIPRLYRCKVSKERGYLRNVLATHVKASKLAATRFAEKLKGAPLNELAKANRLEARQHQQQVAVRRAALVNGVDLTVKPQLVAAAPGLVRPPAMAAAYARPNLTSGVDIDSALTVRTPARPTVVATPEQNRIARGPVKICISLPANPRLA